MAYPTVGDVVRTEQRIREAFAAEPERPLAMRVLSALKAAQTSMNALTLSRLVGAEPSALATVLDGLAMCGLVVRRRDKTRRGRPWTYSHRQ